MKRSTRTILLLTVGIIVAGGVVFAGLIGFFIVGMRSYTPSGLPNWSGGKVDRLGNYLLQSRERLEVRDNDHGLLTFEYFNSDGRKIAESDSSQSSSRPWSLYLDEHHWLWLSGSDTGLRVWRAYTTGVWGSEPVAGNAELEHEIPPSFRQ